MTTYCYALPPKPAAYLIAIIDIILGSVALLLSIVVLCDLEKVFGPLEAEYEGEMGIDVYNRGTLQSRLDRFGHLHDQMVLVLILSALFLILAIGLFIGVRKDWALPIKSWLIYCCTLTLLGVITISVVSIINSDIKWLLLFLAAAVRVYEIWIVFDYLQTSRLSMLILPSSRSSSCERLHNV